MPLFRVGYRCYEGTRTSRLMRWLPITRMGWTIALRSKLLRRVILVSFLPFMYFGVVFFLIGRATDPTAGANSEVLAGILGEVLSPGIYEMLLEDPSGIRTAVWSIVFASFSVSFQLLISGLVAAIVGPPLVANDLRSKSFLIYFARPISRLDYVIGKGGVLIAVLACVSILPSMFLYVLSILFSPSVETLLQTAPVMATVVLATLGSIVPVTLLALAISSLTRQPRFATATWIVLCTFGPLAHAVLNETQGLKDNGWTFLLSLPHTIRALQLGLYDVAGRSESLELGGSLNTVVHGLTSDNSPVRAAIGLAVLSVLCLFLLLRRVDSPTRI